MNRWLEALLLGLGSLAVQVAAWIVLFISIAWDPVVMWVAMWAVALLTTGGVAALGYLAGRRRTVLGLAAVVAFPVLTHVALAVANGVPQP